MNDLQNGAAASRNRADLPPLVTVAVGAFNHERYIVQCLESIICGSYPSIELVIFDDASTDITKRIVRSWIDDILTCKRASSIIRRISD